jgi:flagellar biosynthesis GTPase FlhF
MLLIIVEHHLEDEGEKSEANKSAQYTAAGIEKERRPCTIVDIQCHPNCHSSMVALLLWIIQNFIDRLNPFYYFPFIQMVRNKRQPLQLNEPNKHKHILKKECTGRVKSIIFDGAQTFRQLLKESTIIADRTLFLEQLMGKPRTRTMMFCLPMGVGKTTLLTMAHEFFGIKSKAEKSETRKLFDQDFEGG